ncbi:hypothetical protein BJ741DRAFT_585548 [Chytriomyces cf. hyalinus JEL632]|nr:hypothetical protein BJ741DRAFT_585548 [Chytriomyces cf. hyalinus JEL632]
MNGSVETNVTHSSQETCANGTFYFSGESRTGTDDQDPRLMIHRAFSVWYNFGWKDLSQNKTRYDLTSKFVIWLVEQNLRATREQVDCWIAEMAGMYPKGFGEWFAATCVVSSNELQQNGQKQTMHADGPTKMFATPAVSNHESSVDVNSESNAGQLLSSPKAINAPECTRKPYTSPNEFHDTMQHHATKSINQIPASAPAAELESAAAGAYHGKCGTDVGIVNHQHNHERASPQANSHMATQSLEVAVEYHGKGGNCTGLLASAAVCQSPKAAVEECSLSQRNSINSSFHANQLHAHDMVHKMPDAHEMRNLGNPSLVPHPSTKDDTSNLIPLPLKATLHNLKQYCLLQNEAYHAQNNSDIATFRALIHSYPANRDRSRYFQNFQIPIGMATSTTTERRRFEEMFRSSYNLLENDIHGLWESIISACVEGEHAGVEQIQGRTWDCTMNTFYDILTAYEAEIQGSQYLSQM